MKKKIKEIIQLLILYVSYTCHREKRKKIIIGVEEIANILYNSKKLFPDGCITVCKYRNKYYKKNDYDINIDNKKYDNLFKSPFILGKLAKNARFFIYLAGEGFLFDRELEFRFLKKRNIPIICNFLGSEIRSPRLFHKYCNTIKFNTYIEYDCPQLYVSDDCENKVRTMAEQADKYASIIFNHRHDQYSYIKSEQHFFPMPIDEHLFSFDHEKFANRPLRIIHAPSAPIIKGTPLIRCVVRQLKEEGYDFQYVELIGVSNETVITELKKSHIVLNQFYLLIPGILGLEAMATGNAVLMSAKHEEFPYEFNNAWIETEDWQLYRNLKFLLDNPDKILEYAQNGYEYMKKNFSRITILKHLETVFSENGISLAN